MLDTDLLKYAVRFGMDYVPDTENYIMLKNKIELEDITLYQIKEITFEDKSPRKEALENVISSLQIKGINFVYLIIGNSEGVHFYFGIVKDIEGNEDTEEGLCINDIGDCVLKPSFQGNFRGSKVSKVSPREKSNVIKELSNLSRCSYVSGVPGITEDNEKYQSIDRLVDVMLGEEFAFMILAKPLNENSLNKIEDDLYNFYSMVAPLSKQSYQSGFSEGTTESSSNSQSKSKTEGSSSSKGKQNGTSSSTGNQSSQTHTNGNGTSKSSSKTTTNGNTSSNGVEGSSSSKSYSYGSSDNKSYSVSSSISENNSFSKNSTTTNSNGNSTSKSNGKTLSTSFELTNRKIQGVLKYFDDILFKRVDYAKGKGGFVYSPLLMAKNPGALIKLQNTFKSLFSGESENIFPLKIIKLSNNDKVLNSFRNFQIPKIKIHNLDKDEKIKFTASSRYVEDDSVYYGNWLSTNELSLVAALPQKEIVGLSLKEEIEFGLNFKKPSRDISKINLGKLVQSGNLLQDNDVFLDKDNLNKHIFITGVTGSGKTTTCLKILTASNLPFMVIEPAKTEYRILKNKYKDILIFTLGKDTVAPFRINPFEFFKHESITSRVDMIKACLESAFDMEAAIPQILEAAIYSCYEDFGWNISKNINEKYGDRAFDDGVYAFPTISDLLNKVETVVKEQGFDERLRDEYIGSIKARLQSLTVGSKGLMLNTKKSIDFRELLDKKVILELEEVRSSSEKSLIMGFILINLTEAIKAKYHENKDFKHVLLVEEAHRLLSKYMPGDSLNKKQGIETFTDILAEIRKYGESLIIVDQIPSKLTPEILKNTNTKIVHKLFAQDDKEAIGNTMALSDEQKKFLSYLDVGRTIVFTQGWQKPLQVQIIEDDDNISTTSKVEIKECDIRKSVIDFYRVRYKKGIFSGSNLFKEVPSVEEFDNFINFTSDRTIIDEYTRSLDNLELSNKFKKICLDAKKNNNLKILIGFLYGYCYDQGKSNVDGITDVYDKISEFVEKIISNNLNESDIRKFRDILNTNKNI